MLESVGPLVGSPWIYAAVALSVLLDVFVPLLPSGVLVITAATAAAAGSAGNAAAVAGDVVVEPCRTSSCSPCARPPPRSSATWSRTGRPARG